MAALALTLPSVLSAQATRIISSGTLPATCTVGNIYLKTGTSAGFYVCLTANTWTGPFVTSAGSGDFSSNTSTSVDGEVVLFSGTGGKTGKRATLTASVVKSSSGVQSAASAGTDYVAPGAATSSGLTMATSRLLGRTTASSGAIEEISVGTGLTLSGGMLSSSSTTNVCQTGENDAGSSGTSITLDWNSGNQQIVTLTGNLATLTLSNPVAGCTYRILFVQGSGPYTVTWPSSVKFENDTAPTFTTTNGKVIFCALVSTTLGADGYLGFCTTNPISQP